jgi:hypothetical protein
MATRAEDGLEAGRRAGATVAVLLARVVVPLWLLAGAVLKLADASPSHLPAALIKGAGGLGVNLMLVLQLSIAVELTVVGVMWLLPNLARVVGVAMLGLLLPVLVGDVLLGASSCGCFGAVEVHPAITLTLDVAFFLGLLFLGRGVPALEMRSDQATPRVLAAGLWVVASFVVAFALTGQPASSTEAAAIGVESAAAGAPAEGYYMPDYASWIGKEWQSVPMASWIRPKDAVTLDGTSYVLFYRKDCEHCHELLEVYFSESLPAPTLAVAVPERAGFPEHALSFPCTGCGTAELPDGVDWFLNTPVLVRLSDGVVQCAAEVSAANPTCLQW